MCKQIRHTYYCEGTVPLLAQDKAWAVKVPHFIISQLMWCIQFVSLTTFTMPQYCLLSLITTQTLNVIGSWLLDNYGIIKALK